MSNSDKKQTTGEKMAAMSTDDLEAMAAELLQTVNHHGAAYQAAREELTIARDTLSRRMKERAKERYEARRDNCPECAKKPA